MSERTYDDNMKFVLWINDKGDNPKRPDRVGNATINGVKYKLSGWIRDTARGKCLSGTIQPVDAPKPAVPKPAAKELPPEPDDADSDVPF